MFSFVSHSLKRIKAIRTHQNTIWSVILIQRATRGYYIRKMYGDDLSVRLEESLRFNATWGGSLCQIPPVLSHISGWEVAREQTRDISHAHQDTIEKLTDALSSVFLENEEDVFDEQADGNSWCANLFQVTSHVVKFLKTGDPPYRSFFVRRMHNLPMEIGAAFCKRDLKAIIQQSTKHTSNRSLAFVSFGQKRAMQLLFGSWRSTNQSLAWCGWLMMPRPQRKATNV